MPYLAKFTNYKVKVCSKVSELLSDDAKKEIENLRKTIPSLKHQARLKGTIIFEQM